MQIFIKIIPLEAVAKINGGGLQHVGLKHAVNLRFIRHLQTHTKVFKDPHTLTLVTQISLLLGCFAQKKIFKKESKKINKKNSKQKKCLFLGCLAHGV